MSLLTTASPWNNDESNTNKKRVSTIRKTMNLDVANASEAPSTTTSMGAPFQSSLEKYQILQQPASMDELQTKNQDRATRVNELLNKITSADAANDSATMGNFKPITHPQINVRKDWQGQAQRHSQNHFVASDSSRAELNNYTKSYGAPVRYPPYYASMGIGNGNGQGQSVDTKLLEKINYMIHLLERQQNEPTNNITEEFILYTFLGIFIIFIVDSFARTGKYTR
jgi:hypothetical protein